MTELPRNLFDRAGRLRFVPRKPALRTQVLEWFAQAFEPERRYSEREVNAVIHERHDDHAAIRRYLVDDGHLRRADDGSAYWRPAS